MKYIKPNYTKEVIETNDIVLTSPETIVLGEGMTLTEKDNGGAQVGASAMDILGFR